MKPFDKIKESAHHIRELMGVNANEAIKEIQEQYNQVNEAFNASTLTLASTEAFKIQIKFANYSTNLNPEYATTGSSGFDLRANLGEPLILKVGHRALIPTGLYFEIPNNFEIQIRPRSGLAVKNGITVLNTPGTVDADYRGEIKIILINHGEEDFVINHGDRVAQAVFATVAAKNILNFVQVDEVSTDTDRGTGGFGHSG